MIDKQRIAKKINAAITASGIKQAAIAAEIGISQQAVGKWMKTGKIDKTNLAKLAAITNRTVEWFLSEDGKTAAIQEGKTVYVATGKGVTTLAARLLHKLPEPSRSSIVSLILELHRLNSEQ